MVTPLLNKPLALYLKMLTGPRRTYDTHTESFSESVANFFTTVGR